MGETDAPGQWHEYRRLVIDQLERLGTETASLRESTVKAINELRNVMDGDKRNVNEEIATLRERIARIEGKAAAYGFVAGLVVSLIVGMLQFLPRPYHPPPQQQKAASYGYTIGQYHDHCFLHDHRQHRIKLRPEGLPRGASKVRRIGATGQVGETHAR